MPRKDRFTKRLYSLSSFKKISVLFLTKRMSTLVPYSDSDDSESEDIPVIHPQVIEVDPNDSRLPLFQAHQEGSNGQGPSISLTELNPDHFAQVLLPGAYLDYSVQNVNAYRVLYIRLATARGLVLAETLLVHVLWHELHLFAVFLAPGEDPHDQQDITRAMDRLALALDALALLIAFERATQE